MKKQVLSTLIVLFGIVSIGFSQDFVYQPVNPAFGGDPFNYQWMLSSASEQNDHKEESTFSSYEQDPLSDFENSLNRQILSQLSRKLVDNIFGEGDLQDGTFEIGGFQIDIASGSDGVTVKIFDAVDGGETVIVIPYY
ncbi:curli assembly protein CsgF [Marivirga salinae]|uniref:Curli production assembly/transport component CsgF n=1 Tax=Marivirga salinarum TaxID=3059078 RepID=A0AA51R8B6_9BACT|nr:curli assembly protein CsgF [Marivirga sp. BDSF4-3]WMN11012.1 curli assembly protein CsgF [Marivirga sp. BDSF4-3]